MLLEKLKLDVTSRVSQRSVHGPLLFAIYINDTDEGIVSKISNFADDTKFCARAHDEKEAIALKGDLDRLHKWFKDWSTPLSNNHARAEAGPYGRGPGSLGVQNRFGVTLDSLGFDVVEILFKEL